MNKESILNAITLSEYSSYGELNTPLSISIEELDDDLKNKATIPAVFGQKNLICSIEKENEKLKSKLSIYLQLENKAKYIGIVEVIHISSNKVAKYTLLESTISGISLEYNQLISSKNRDLA